MATPPPPSSSSPSPAPAPSGRPATAWWVGAVAVALLLAVAGYALGHSTGVSSTEDEYAEGEPKYEEIFNAGASAGTEVGESAGKKQGVAAGEKAGFERGEEEGKQEGEKAGEAAGLEQGQAEGRKSGASAALAFSTWNTGAPYIVRVQESDTADVPYSVSTRTQMDPGKAYALCTGSATDVCVKTEASTASGE